MIDATRRETRRARKVRRELADAVLPGVRCGCPYAAGFEVLAEYSVLLVLPVEHAVFDRRMVIADGPLVLQGVGCVGQHRGEGGPGAEFAALDLVPRQDCPTGGMSIMAGIVP
jgi:hypothetical protein